MLALALTWTADDAVRVSAASEIDAEALTATFAAELTVSAPSVIVAADLTATAPEEETPFPAWVAANVPATLTVATVVVAP
jgi:hypothetical protein